PRVYSQRLDEPLCAFTCLSPRHFWLRHRSLPPDGRGCHFPQGDRLHVGYGHHCGPLFQCDRVICGSFPIQDPDNQPEWWVLAVVITALVFQPMVNWIQVRLDRFFSPERYDYRRTLLEFARELSSELHVDRLLEQVTVRLAGTLGVDRLAVFWATGSDQFRLVKSRGVS